MSVVKLNVISVVLVLFVIGFFASPIPEAFAAGPTISISSINNVTPRWGVDTVTVSGSVTNANPGDTVTVTWGDATNSTGFVISANSWGPANHIYPLGKVGGHNIAAKLVSSTGTIRVSSAGSAITVQKHITTLSTPTLNSTSVKWGKAYNVTSITLTDSDSGGTGVSGKTISISGNGTTGTPTVTTNSNGNLPAPVTITSPGIFNTGTGNVFANFAGDLNYISSSSGTTIQVTKHATSLTKPTSVSSVRWGQTFTADSILRDSDLKVPISGASVTYNGNGTASPKTDFSNSTGHTQTTVTAAGLGHVGLGQINATFAGDVNYLSAGPATSTITITPHPTTLSTPTLNSTSVKWGKAFSVTDVLTDSVVGQGVSGKTISISGNGTTGTPSGTTNSTGFLAPTTITAPGIFNTGTGNVFANFAGDINYISSSSGTTIQVTKHVTSLSAPTFNSANVQTGQTFTADSILRDSDLNAPISGASVTYNGNGTASPKTDSSNSTGHIQTTLTAATVSSNKTGLVSVTFNGDNNYLSSGPITSTITITTAPTQFVDASKIKHIVVIVQENRSFDHYFGTYPGVNGIPPGECMPLNAANPSLGCIKPFHTLNFSTVIDLNHDQLAALTAVDNGKMDNFIVGEEGRNETMGYLDNTTIPNYWTFAKKYVLADNYFSSVEGWSIPNHWYSIAGQAPAISIPTFLNPGEISNATKTTYLQQANAINTISDSMNNTGNISWKVYTADFGNIVAGGYHAAELSGFVYDFWDVWAAKASTYTANYAPHFNLHTQIFTDLQNNQLPQVSYVLPPDFLSEHPPATSHAGMIWTTDVIDSIMNSTAWNSTAIILTWDDYGGYYDHVPPLNIDQYGSGIRVPTLIISPYAKQGFIDHTPYIHESTLKFIEWKFNMTSLTARDANANNLFNAFDFKQTPRPPTPIHLSANDLAQLTPYYLIPRSGHVGDNVTFIGNGFNSGDSGTVTYNDALIASGIANATGTIVTTFKIPPSPAGCQTVVDQDYTGTLMFGLGIINHCFTVTQNEILNPSTGPSGVQININGTGFSAGSTITIQYDGTTQSTTASNSNGGFGIPFNIPSSSLGTHSISATDAKGRTSSKNFIVTNAPFVTISNVNNTSPKWSLDAVSASGTTTNSVSGDSITVSWGDNTNSTGIPISGNSWGPVVHTYSSSSIASNPNQVTAKLIASNNSVKATSTPTSINVQKHPTTLSTPTLSSASAKWSKTFNVNAETLTDSATGQGVLGETINFSGNGTTGTPSGITTVGGGLTAPVTITASINIGPTDIVSGNFTGDAKYMSSSSSTIIQILKHVTSLSPPTFNSTSVKWGKGFTADSILTDSDAGGIVSGEQITFAGNGTSASNNAVTNSTGHANTGLTTPGIGHVGHGQVNSTFVGDSRYLPTGQTTSIITITPHSTAISKPALSATSIKWGMIFKVNTPGSIQLVDSDLAGKGISGKTITFTGTATTGTPTGTTSASGKLTAAVSITASTSVGPGKTVIGNFAGDANYVSSSSPSASITVSAHKTSITWGTITNVPEGSPTSFPITLTDSDNGGTGIQGKTISYNGTGVIGVSNPLTNSAGQATGHGTAPVTVATGWTVQAHFGGDLLYINKDSTIKHYSTTK